MNRLFVMTTCWVAIAITVGPAVLAQRPGVPPGATTLPAPDPTIQKWLGAMLDPKTHFTTMSEVYEAGASRKFTKEAWLAQILLFASRLDGEKVLGAEGLLLNFSRQYLGIDAGTALEILAPYLDASDQRVVKIAGELIMSWISPVLTEAADVTGTSELSAYHDYLSSCGSRDPSWKLVRQMYEISADAAFGTALRVYSETDRDARERMERGRKELLILMLSYDLAADEQKNDANRKVLDKLNGLAEHPQWYVRGYALAVVMRNIILVPAKGAHWATETTIPARLSEDKNPFVSGFAKEVVQRIRMHQRAGF